MEELEAVASQGDMILFLHSENCPHCKETLPVIEEECSKSDASLNFVECEVSKNPHCLKLAKAAKISGVPVTMALPRGASLAKPEWKVTGARKEELREKIKKTNGRVSASAPQKEGGRKGPSGAPPAQRPTPQTAGPVQRTHAADRAVIKMLGRAPTLPPDPEMQAYAAPRPVDLCVPNKECSRDEFERRFVDFYAGQW
jgi:glutaredoxin